MEKKITVEYTQAEANAALRLYDIAVRAQGMAAVEVAVHLSNKLKQAANGAGTEKPDDTNT